MRNTQGNIHSPKWQKEQVSVRLLITAAPQFGWVFFLLNIRQQQNLTGNKQQKFPTSPVDTQKWAEPPDWGIHNIWSWFVNFIPRDRERRKENASDTWQGHSVSLCQRESLPQLHSWCSSLHPWDKTLLPPWTDTPVSPAAACLILLNTTSYFY